jgi:hypothetical protein
MTFTVSLHTYVLYQKLSVHRYLEITDGFLFFNLSSAYGARILRHLLHSLNTPRPVSYDDGP